MTAALSLTDGRLLARLAAGAVRARLAGDRLVVRLPQDSALHADGASFVTLERAGTLRGCVGTLEPARPLHRDVVRNALRAMNDPRLPPVTGDDWPLLDVKVSVLGRPVRVPTRSREELLTALVPGEHGLILTDGRRRATFLPSVWSKLPEPELFLSALLRKGGWPPDRWPPEVTAWCYGATEFHDRPPRTPLGPDS
ncbi:AmmeMemoRadiSam system protein A [Dactylosporangium roseum]|uniref:AmmeMemoRadiSam system protein A n=1 Tax=Dactylosporangium roseum TaxID=47989 RepID=A0ABY5Z5M8_9ACTN|nr:AmmeMemoRadiSam system protein A [Dactylosporangium roseum]UWZ37356.1 AmmeMemoRadiSam system protein A [Dactylosporangium roseum]